jgi:preprotein translocase subunit SecD
MFKNVHIRLALISAVFTVCLLIILPRIPVVINKYGVNIDSFVGGYIISLPGERVLNLSEFKRGLDLEGGVRIVLGAKMDKIPAGNRVNALESAKEVISRRVNLLGVSEPNIQTVKVGDSYRILVEVPGVSDVDQAVKLLGQTAQLKFKVIKPGQTWDQTKFIEFYSDPTKWEDTNLTGSDLKGAVVSFAQAPGSVQQTPQVQLQFTNEGRKKFSQIARANVDKPVALFLDNDQSPISMATISPELADGVTQDPVIQGNFDAATANNLSLQIRAGALPVPVEVLEQKTVGATLGEESIKKSFFAGGVGLFLVVMFMIYSYGRYGLLAGIALFIYTIVNLAIFKVVPVVLTLPGIAGFVLSIGVATDANILVFERVREEKRWGAPTGLAIKYGFDRAWNSIKDSNIASLISAAILFYFGTGAIRGFALTLAIGIAVSLFSSIFVVKTLIEVFGYTRKEAR